ncbi:MAG: uncharacterized protein KVP18_000973 [Porospora cf. gigantea A]|uniref:uncharacterized protein n=1 Tax=Porospora cf. gigantea A TaxID=2853593 RepID=UPI00355AA979|nr:MAG: hypothetical protein KVP18_000973 [Porospora cf. gigantea A]
MQVGVVLIALAMSIKPSKLKKKVIGVGGKLQSAASDLSWKERRQNRPGEGRRTYIQGVVHKADTSRAKSSNVYVAEQDLIRRHREGAKPAKESEECRTSPPSTLRDFRAPCPQNWLTKPYFMPGECWGPEYEGPCDSVVNFGVKSIAEKRAWEAVCCGWFPPLNIENKEVSSEPRISPLNGPVDQYSGQVAG